MNENKTHYSPRQEDETIKEEIKRVLAALSQRLWADSSISINGHVVEIRDESPPKGEQVTKPWILRGSSEIHLPNNNHNFFPEMFGPIPSLSEFRVPSPLNESLCICGHLYSEHHGTCEECGCCRRVPPYRATED